MFRNVSLKCLTEIAGVSVSQYEEQFVTLFTLTMMQLKQVMLDWSNAKTYVLRRHFMTFPFLMLKLCLELLKLVLK